MLEPDEKGQDQCHKDMFVEDMIIAYRPGGISAKTGEYICASQELWAPIFNILLA